ncbi:MAG: hypothetical protein E7270_06745 [Lachnospiraceae bacterium]|nr:hypothetical protein [Lachnospiraceae bacterium]
MSNLKGVFIAYKKDGTKYYRSSLTYRNKHISLGSYTTEAYANTAYREGSQIISNPDIYIDNLDSYISILSFEKCVSLINFRDNGIYFKTPIYMHQKYFDYYLNEEIILKFDVDDLFFYAKHTIMKRDGHLFVADYGMQINIMSRYGIKNYAVPGKDYVFKNGDYYDFRYKNIEIINRYYGVTHETKRGKKVFICKIHINGDFIVGKYAEETDAAIAYNKAVDVLNENGVHHNYNKNYIDNLTPMEYATKYNKIKISSKIRNYKE